MLTVVGVSPLPQYVLHLMFSDGVTGTFDVSALLYGEVFEPLKDETYFSRVSIDEFGTVSWPNGADLDTDVLYDGVMHRASAAAHSSEN